MKHNRYTEGATRKKRNTGQVCEGKMRRLRYRKICKRCFSHAGKQVMLQQVECPGIGRGHHHARIPEVEEEAVLSRQYTFVVDSRRA
jgi:hypothetical protein